MSAISAIDYGTSVTKPADFDQFWRDTLAVTAVLPLDPEVRPVHERSTEEVEVFEVRYTSWERIRIACWYCRPRGARDLLPAIIHLPGYVSEPILPKSTARRGYAALSVAPRGKLRSNRHFNPGYPGLLTHNIVDRNTYSYRGFYLDALRAVDFLLSRPEVDPGRIGAAGGSQGGGLTVVVAAMRPEIKAASAGAPYLCGMMDAILLTNSYPYQEINDYLRMYPERVDQVRQTLAYFDIINFADRLTCPILVNIGLDDDVCPPETGYALFKAIGSKDKKLYEYADCMHDAGSFWHGRIVEEFLDRSLRPAM